MHAYPEIFKIPKYNLTIKGWSRGSQNTGFYIPELKLLLDTQSHQNFDPEFILITHTHTDHCFSLPMRLTCINTKPIIAIPKESQKFIVDFVNATFKMGYNNENYIVDHKFIGVSDKDTIPLKNNIYAKVFSLDHNVPCVGYGLNITKTKLKQEYLGINKNDILNLKQKGINITTSYDEPILAYLTDTTTSIFEKYPELLSYPYIMTECTFVPCKQEKIDKEIQLANDSKHTHWNFLYPIIKENPHVTFILIHFSNRYNDEELLKFKETIAEKNIIFAI